MCFDAHSSLNRGSYRTERGSAGSTFHLERDRNMRYPALPRSVLFFLALRDVYQLN